MKELTVLRGLMRDPLFSALLTRETEADDARFLSLLFEKRAETSLFAYIEHLVLTDDNAFSRTAAAGETPSDYLFDAYTRDLGALRALLDPLRDDSRFDAGIASDLFGRWDRAAAHRLIAYFRGHGYGIFSEHSAFRYENGALVPVAEYKVALSDLKRYEREKQEILANTENFVRGLPYADMFLYGDRGTGKSSTVHAVANAYRDRKVRLVELGKEDVLALPRVCRELAACPMRFLLFLDDFSLAGDDERLSSVKSSLQGAERRADNIMIVTTGNRRHIVAEDGTLTREDAQELLSLSDRFGLTVLFSSTDKAAYLDIVHSLAADCGLRTELSLLDGFAERFALRRGGRSPRCARQCVDYLAACEQKGVSIEL